MLILNMPTIGLHIVLNLNTVPLGTLVALLSFVLGFYIAHRICRLEEMKIQSNNVIPR